MTYDAETRTMTTEHLILRPFREEDVPALLGAGLEAVFPAGASVNDMADYLRRRCALTGTY